MTDADRGRYGRRHVLALGAGVGAALLAGCATGTTLNGPDGGSSGDTDGGASRAGTFRLLISDQPVAIDDFDELNVSFDRARLFRGEGVDDPEAGATDTPAPTTAMPETTTEPATATDTEGTTAGATDEANVTATPTTAVPTTAAEPGEADDDPDDGEPRGFTGIDLGGATVDLTTVIGDDAIPVFEGELEEGRYAKIELHAADVEGIVDGELVEVTIPSGKLQIVKPFEVAAGEELSFVFDINVVKKGPTGGYNLLPVISESGVVGEEVEANEVANRHDRPDGTDDDEELDHEEDEADDDPGAAGGEDGRGNGDDQGPPDDGAGGS